MVAQAAALLLWDVCLLAVSFVTSVTSPGQGLSEVLRSRSGVGLFVELLVFGALATAVPCVVLLRTLCPQHAASRGPVSPRKANSLHVSIMRDLLCICGCAWRPLHGSGVLAVAGMQAAIVQQSCNSIEQLCSGIALIMPLHYRGAQRRCLGGRSCWRGLL